MKQNITLIKLGGSIITNKEIPMMVREAVLKRLVHEIVRARQETGELFIVGHGQGSFAHAPALKYKTMDGFINEQSPMGMAITQDSAAQLNRIVVKEFLAAGMPAVSFNFSNSMVTNKNAAQHWCGEVLEEYLAKGLFPITCGDVLVDATKGCTIWSTEKVLGYLAQYFASSKKYQIKKMIHVAEVAGVLDGAGQVVPEITTSNLEKVRELITTTKGFDVTGGMAHKLEESMKLAVGGVRTGIITGLEKDFLYKSLTSEEMPGTVIRV